ncbi:MAG TPA: VOC family protein [Pyrinomonadaceae bacterium]|jgi:catechol 2,3-dioxygenase-like lactoylglutathione lyase family enzyme
MEVTGLDLLFLEVNSLEESLLFYREQLGLEVLTYTPEAEPPMMTLRVGSTRITLVQQLETMLRRGRGVHFFFSVTDVDAYYGLLTTRGMDLRPPADEGWGGRFITLEDPDKYRLFFVTWDEAT